MNGELRTYFNSYFALFTFCAIFFVGHTKAQYYNIRVSEDSNKMYPTNIQITDTSFANYMKKLNWAIKNKNTTALLALMDSNIKCSFGGDYGRAGVINMWHPDTKGSQLWATLSRIIEIGGTCDTSHTNWVFPYVFALPDYYDPFFSFVITGENVSLREKPHKHSKVIKKLSYDIVVQYDTGGVVIHEKSPLNPLGGPKWYHVRMIHSKCTGYVLWKDIWSPVDYRFGLIKYKGKWSMEHFVGGD